MSAPDVCLDHLELGKNAQITKLLKKEFDNMAKKGGAADQQVEKVIFSDYVIKINRKLAEQTRTLLITDMALYNLKKNTTLKRRIPFQSIEALTTSEKSDEFVVHVPDEYDYRFKSAKKDEIISVIRKYSKINDSKINVLKVANAELTENTLTKRQAELQTREERLMRKQVLAAQEKSSDADDRKEVGENSDQISSHLDVANDSKVGIADFELLKVLGRGAFGKVMQVKKKNDGKIYAMKILKKAAILAKNQVEHTKAERKILQQLQHPFLMKLRYAFQSKDKLYLVLDYFQGGELFFHLKNQRRFAEKTAKLYVAEIAMAFGHLHEAGVIYRDLKPENILLDDEGHVCLTDFGLAKEVDEGEKTETFCGTPEYLAPEIIQAQGHDKAVDWWSLGILLYELTVGIPPFYSQNVNDMYNKIQHGVLRFPPFLTPECKSLIVALLNREPKKRLGSDKDFLDLKSHDFFKELDWDKVYKKEVEVAFKPTVSGQEDTSNFDEEFLSEPVVDSVVPPSAIDTKSANEYSGFTFAAKPAHLG